ncbi:MAG TPA: L-serine ammonia-lyase, iron-sulfur-dependent, subunit alpha [Bacillota bacterium]|nr:L-serine ammonia-lyase, iron-sulfur-dependent, subunit alpha [Bacillota bacterium]
MKQFPSIFNDVIGPVMIGHSSSHTAASVRIGRVIRQLAGNDSVKHVKFSFDKNSSLAATYNSQGSDLGLLAGILGYDTYDREILEAFKLAEENGIQYDFEVKDIGPGHPNTYYIEFICKIGKIIKLTAVSTGGGMFEIIEYMGFPVLIDGGFFEALVICERNDKELISSYLKEKLHPGHIAEVYDKGEKSLINIKSEKEISDLLLQYSDVRVIRPIMPVTSQINPHVPFITGVEMKNFAKEKHLPLWQLAIIYESERSGLSKDEVMNKMLDIISILKKSLDTPLSEDFSRRILHNQHHLLEGKNLLGGSFTKRVIEYITWFMDIKSSMGVFVAAPTAGSCGCLPGTVFALSKEMELDDEAMAKAMLSAGLIGVIIAYYSTFAAEVCGCQAECGAGSGMCAGACTEIMGGSAEECLAAASMALQNVFGMVCDPVANKVEVPCLGKNIMCGFNGIASANMAISGFSEVIPIDETIKAMDSVGKSIPRELRCTGLGGLSVTSSGQKIKKELGES